MALEMINFVFIIVLLIIIGALHRCFPIWSETGGVRNIQIPHIFIIVGSILACVALWYGWNFNQREQAYNQLSRGMSESEVFMNMGAPSKYTSNIVVEPKWDGQRTDAVYGAEVKQWHYYFGFQTWVVGFSTSELLVSRGKGMLQVR